MARQTGPKNKLSRKVGEDLGLKSNPLKVARRLSIKPGQHGAKGRRKVSDYGTQLMEKQKLKYIYGILEKQLRKIYEEASQDQAATGTALLSRLERRLDNVVYRAGWAPTRASARQIVSHGHIQVNQKKMNIPSYRVQVDDIITISGTAIKIPAVSDLVKTEITPPDWLQKKQGVLKIARLPERDEITEAIEEQLIIEYYSR